MLNRRGVIALGSASALGAGFIHPANAAPGIATKDGIALGDYDAASYWTSKKALKGRPEFSHGWSGATWIFADQANRDAFVAAPQKYVPALNGYCPFCLAGGKLVPGLGNFWDVHKGSSIS